MLETAPPSAAHAALEECTSAFLELRRAHARAVGAVARLGGSDALTVTGHRSLARLLEEHVRVDAPEARRLIRHGELLHAPAALGLVPGAEAQPPEPDLPTTAAATSAGTIGPDHVHVVDHTMLRLQQVVPALPVPVLDETEQQLVGLARARSPRQLADAAHEILLRLDPDGELPHDAERPAEELRLHTGRDGTLTGRFRFAEPDAADAVRAAIAARTPAPEPETDTTPLRPGRDLPARQGEALRALVDDAGPATATDGPDTDGPDTDGPDTDEMASTADDSTHHSGERTRHDRERDDDRPRDADAPPLRLVDAGSADRDSAPTPEPLPSPGTPRGGEPRRDRPTRETTMIVTVPLDVLTGERDGGRPEVRGRQGHTLLDGRWAVTPETARRLACDAAIVPAVLGVHGEPLDLGRKTRVITSAQRRAVIARDRHCAHPGCRRSPRRCDVHHVVPWHLGGVTDLLNLVLLCPYHHHQIHHSDWEVHMRDGHPTFIPPAWLDPLRTPRTNRVAPHAA